MLLNYKKSKYNKNDKYGKVTLLRQFLGGKNAAFKVPNENPWKALINRNHGFYRVF